MSQITFANGERRECVGFSAAEGAEYAYVRIGDVDFVDAARIFSDDSCVREITYGNSILKDFRVQSIAQYSDGVEAVLRGGYYERRK